MHHEDENVMDEEPFEMTDDADLESMGVEEENAEQFEEDPDDRYH